MKNGFAKGLSLVSVLWPKENWKRLGTLVDDLPAGCIGRQICAQKLEVSGNLRQAASKLPLPPGSPQADIEARLQDVAAVRLPYSGGSLSEGRDRKRSCRHESGATPRDTAERVQGFAATGRAGLEKIS